MRKGIVGAMSEEKNIQLVTASAGSGKTYALSERVETAVKSADPESIMATTFTVKAAAELQSRIRLRLLKDGHTAAAQRVMDGLIGTVNSVCGRLLREYAIDAGESPALEVLPPDDSEAIFKTAISSVIGSRFDDVQPAAVRLGYVKGASDKFHEKDWRKDIEAIVAAARNNSLTADDLRRFGSESWKTLEAYLGEPASYDLARLATDIRPLCEEHRLIKPKQGNSKAAQAVFDNFMAKTARGEEINWPDVEKLMGSDAKSCTAAAEVVGQIKGAAGATLRCGAFIDDVKTLVLGVMDGAAEALEIYSAYKKEQGLMDFADQEAGLLDLARRARSFETSMRDRLSVVLVDEFQDTSPIELAVFLELNRLCGRSVWVGDPKQAIYNFRGTDPELMQAASRDLTTTVDPLSESWRSRRALVDFTNAVFTTAFHEQDPATIRLSIPKKRASSADGGWIECWELLSSNASNDAASVARGLAELVSDTARSIKPGAVAILCRTNQECEDMASALEEQHLAVSGERKLLINARETKLALAALRYQQSGRNLLALAELRLLLAGGRVADNWLEDVLREPQEAIGRWRLEEAVRRLDEARRAEHQTPLDALDAAIDLASVRQTIATWPDAAGRLANLDKLRGVCTEYEELCRARRSAATSAGFIRYLGESEAKQAASPGGEAVHVLTYHRAKGLEWPIVVMTGLNKTYDARVFEPATVPASVFNPANPLEGRSIRYWPRLETTFYRNADFKTRVNAGPEMRQAEELSQQEGQRLLYVGMTRARDGLVLAIRKETPKTKPHYLADEWLQMLRDKDGHSVLSFTRDGKPLLAGPHAIPVGGASIEIVVKEFDHEILTRPKSKKSVYIAPSVDPKSYPAKRLNPSLLKDDPAEEVNARAEVFADLRDYVCITGEPDKWKNVGNAVHAYLAAESNAAKIIEAWGLENIIDLNNLINYTTVFMDEIKKRYPDAPIYREWPMTLRRPNGQLVQGWIDMLVEMPDGFVIIDHKLHPAPNILEDAVTHAAQLAAYTAAVAGATGQRVIDTLIHYPIFGKLVRVTQK